MAKDITKLIKTVNVQLINHIEALTKEGRENQYTLDVTFKDLKELQSNIEKLKYISESLFPL